MAKLLIAAESELLSSILTQTCTLYEVHSCHNGADALALLEALQPDIFIVELSLPVVCGLTVLQTASYKPPVILALTNFVTSHLLQAAAQAGVQELLLIPCSVQSIIARLDALTKKSLSSDG